jgi:hypothetical protein
MHLFHGVYAATDGRLSVIGRLGCGLVPVWRPVRSGHQTGSPTH